MDDTRKLLTIAIPTYNRAACLDLCLTSIFSQISGFEDEVEIHVSDNCSTDDTAGVVSKYMDCARTLSYTRNAENIGAARNFVKCFSNASGRYVWIFGDDDVLVDGALSKVLAVLRGHSYGVVTLSTYGFKESYSPRRVEESQAFFYDDCAAFFDKVHVFITFVSGNIINKNLVPPNTPLELFSRTQLPQLAWLIPAAIGASPNVYISGGLVAGKENNSGGYPVCKVFGETLCGIFDHFVSQGANPACFVAVRRRMLTDFFPSNIYTARLYGRFEREDYFHSLRPLYGRDVLFWLHVVPAIKLPLALANLWRKTMSGFLRLSRALFVPEVGKEIVLGTNV